MQKIKLTLASASVHRKAVLESMGIPFDVLPTHADELDTHPSGPAQLVLENAKLKAKWVLDNYPESFALTSDTVVTLGDHIFNKPKSLDEAKSMLELMRAKTVDVYTSACLRHLPSNISDDYVEVTKLFMGNYTNEQIQNYFNQINPLTVSGALALEVAMDCHIIDSYEGSKANCIGLPKEYLEELFQKINWPTTSNSK